MSIAITSPYPQFFDLAGRPLEAGYISIGLVNQNPKTAPKACYWDAALTQPAAQPLRTVNGYIVRAGTPAVVYVDGNFSTLVQDSTSRQIYYFRNSVEAGNASAVQAALDAYIAAVANAADADEGAALMGHSWLLDYPDDTVGAHLNELYELQQSGSLSPKDPQFGATGDGATNDHAAFLLWAAAVNSSGRDWVIPPGNYLLDGASTINLRTSGRCFGTLLIPKSNHDTRIVFERDVAGAVISTTGWTAMNRGANSANALNAAGKYLDISSTLVLIERDGNPATPYLKQEFIRATNPDGTFTTPLVNTYGVPASPTVTVTAYEPSRPIFVQGLRIRRTGVNGGVENGLGCLRVERDAATFQGFQLINDNPAQPLAVGVDVVRCADVVFQSPHIQGLQYPGLGYGINLSNTIGFVCEEPVFVDCRHSISGRHNVDAHLKGGNYGGAIDDHWGDRMVIETPVVTVKQGESCVQYAGNDITIINPTCTNGRNLLSIRADTPQLGGAVVIENPRHTTRGEVGFYYMFGFTSPNPTQTGFTTTPRLPDSVVIENPVIDTDTAETYGMYLGVLLAPHINWGMLKLSGSWTCTAATTQVGIFLWKDATYQTGRASHIALEGSLNFGATGVGAYASSIDASATRAATITVDGMTQGNLRWSPYSCDRALISNSRVGYIENDNAITVPGSCIYTITGCEMLGGLVSNTFRRMAFLGNNFTGNYTDFPIQANVTMDANVRLSTVTGLPGNIRSAVVAPYA
jgi:hypothetical protein